jgi:hypothetical protein
MTYELDQFVSDCRTILTRDPGPKGREEVRGEVVHREAEHGVDVEVQDAGFARAPLTDRRACLNFGGANSHWTAIGNCVPH